jgi:capsular exopolysaccharide synthesis family protein
MNYLRAVRRRWRVIFAMVVLAGVAGWFTTRTIAQPNAGPTSTYHASDLIVNTSIVTSHGGITSFDTLSVFVTTRTVGDRVAEQLGFKGDSIELVQKIQPTADTETGVLTLTATGSDPRETEQLADAFADQLIAYAEDLRNANLRAEIVALKAQIADIQAEQKDTKGNTESGGTQPTGGRGGTDTGTPLPSGSDTSIATLQQQIESDKTDIAAPIGLTVIERAHADKSASEGIEAPDTRAGRVGLAALLGLVLGVALALVLDRFDNKIRTREVAERRFGVPVLAEVPRFPRSERRKVISASRAGAPAADAFRLLGAGITRLAADKEDADENGSGDAAARRSFVILVTSCGPGEGKTTVIANLAAIYAEVGKKVLVLSCDLRRPAIHGLFGVPNHPGLSDALMSMNGASVLDGRVLQTSLANVSMVPSGKEGAAHAGLLGSDHMRRVLEESRARADVVLMDCAPILVSSEVAPLIADVDAVVLVAEAGKTSGVLAERAAELVNRLGAEVVGVVLNRASEIAIPKGYYRYYSSSAVSSGRGSRADAKDDEVDSAAPAGP